MEEVKGSSEMKITALMLLDGSDLVLGEPYARMGEVESIAGWSAASFIVKFKENKKFFIVPSRTVTIIEMEQTNVDS